MSFWPGDNGNGPVSPDELSMIEGLREEGMSIREIADLMHRSKNTVERCLNPDARKRDLVSTYMSRHGVPYSRPKLRTVYARSRSYRGREDSSEERRQEIYSAFDDDPSMFLEFGFDSADEGWAAFEDMTDDELEEYA